MVLCWSCLLGFWLNVEACRDKRWGGEAWVVVYRSEGSRDKAVAVQGPRGWVPGYRLYRID